RRDHHRDRRGGRDARLSPRALGQAHPPPRAGRLRPAREGELGLARRRGREPLPHQEPWYDRDGKEFHAGTHYFVGGNTKFYGAALIRLRRQDFGQVAHHGGVSPAWPIAYDDLEPYYTEAEHLYQVHGLRGSDPTEPPASAPYLHPPLSHEPRIQAMFDGFVRQGHRPFPIPIGLMLDEQNPR